MADANNETETAHTPSSSSRSQPSPPCFPLASHASIVRAAEKDQGYTNDLYERVFSVGA